MAWDLWGDSVASRVTILQYTGGGGPGWGVPGVPLLRHQMAVEGSREGWLVDSPIHWGSSAACLCAGRVLGNPGLAVGCRFTRWVWVDPRCWGLGLGACLPLRISSLGLRANCFLATWACSAVDTLVPWASLWLLPWCGIVSSQPPCYVSAHAHARAQQAHTHMHMDVCMYLFVQTHTYTNRYSSLPQANC